MKLSTTEANDPIGRHVQKIQRSQRDANGAALE